MVIGGVVNCLYKVVTWLCFGVTWVRHQHEVSGGKWRLSFGNTGIYYSCPTAIILLFTVTHHVQSVAVCVIPYGYSKSWKI